MRMRSGPSPRARVIVVILRLAQKTSPMAKIGWLIVIAIICLVGCPLGYMYLEYLDRYEFDEAIWKSVYIDAYSVLPGQNASGFVIKNEPDPSVAPSAIREISISNLRLTLREMNIVDYPIPLTSDTVQGGKLIDGKIILRPQEAAIVSLYNITLTKDVKLHYELEAYTPWFKQKVSTPSSRVAWKG